MQRGQTSVLILVGILVIVAVAGGAYFLGRQATPKSSPSPVLTTQTPQPTTSLESTNSAETANPDLIGANWKTYTNTKAGFMIKYPPRYTKPTLPSGAPGSPIIYADENSKGDIIFGETSTDAFSMVVFPFKDNLQEIFTTTEAKGRPPYNWTTSENIFITSKDIMIDKVNAKWLTASYKLGVKDVYTAIFFTKGGFGFILNPSPNHDAKEINQILSTFKFQ